MSKPYPKTMHHPHFKRGKMRAVPSAANAQGLNGVVDYQGEPDLFPPVTVNNESQEGFYRAKGYLNPGESPPPKTAYAEYPVMLVHPDHIDGIPDTFDVKKGPGGIEHIRIPGRPEKFPPVAAKNAADEEAWGKKGYVRAGKADAEASAKERANPYNPHHEHQEYPKLVDGVLVDPFNEIGFERYPMWVGDTVVQNEAEERAARAKNPDAAKAPPAERCIICGQEFKPGEAHAMGTAGPYHADHLGAGPTVPISKAAVRARMEKKRKVERTKRVKQPSGLPGSIDNPLPGQG